MTQFCEICNFNNPKGAVTGIIIKDNRVLVLQRKEEPFKDKMDFPGGYMNAGETPKQTMRREIKEELGADCTLTFIGWFSGNAFWQGKKFAVLNHAFLVEPQEPLKLNEQENSLMKFVPIDELTEIAFDSNEDILKFVKDKFLVDWLKLSALVTQLDASAKINENNFYKAVLNGYVSKKFVGDKLVGIGWIFPRRTLLRKQAVIEDMVVDQTERGKGYGKEIVLDLIRWAKDNGMDTIELTSGAHRVAANELYKKVGFKLHPTNHYLYSIHDTY